MPQISPYENCKIGKVMGFFSDLLKFSLHIGSKKFKLSVLLVVLFNSSPDFLVIIDKISWIFCLNHAQMAERLISQFILISSLWSHYRTSLLLPVIVF